MEPGLFINTVFGNLPLSACLAYQLQDYGRPNTTFLTNYSGGTTPQDSSVPKCLEFPDIPHVDVAPFDLNEIQALGQTDFIDFFVDHVLTDYRKLMLWREELFCRVNLLNGLTNTTTDSLPPILVKFISEFKGHQKLC